MQKSDIGHPKNLKPNRSLAEVCALWHKGTAKYSSTAKSLQTSCFDAMNKWILAEGGNIPWGHGEPSGYARRGHVPGGASKG